MTQTDSLPSVYQPRFRPGNKPVLNLIFERRHTMPNATASIAL